MAEDENQIYYIRLVNLGKRKFKVFRVLKKALKKVQYVDQEIFDWFALNVPRTLRKELTLGEALKIKEKFQKAGAHVVIKNQNELGNDLMYLKKPPFRIIGGHGPPLPPYIEGLKCPHCGEAGQCIQTHRAKRRQDTTRQGIFFGSKTWQTEMNVRCDACGLASTIKGSSHYGF